jgi:chaperonin GroES
MSNIKPLGNRILVKRLKAQTSKGGILLPDSAQEKPKEGIVVAVGPGKMNDQGHLEAMTVQPGQKVLFGLYSGTEIKNNEGDDEYLILIEDDIFGILS